MFVICIESSHRRGLGHLFRSLNLARELRKRGYAVRFLVNDHDRSRALIQSNGFAHDIYPLVDPPGSWEARFLDEHPDVSVWINDRLDTDPAHAGVVRAATRKLITFDDRSAAADAAELNVSALIFDHADRLKGKHVVTGPRYLILDAAIGKYRRQREALGSIVVTLGGADTYGVTLKVLELLAQSGRSATVVTGPAFGHLDQLHALLDQPGYGEFLHKANVPSLAEEMSRHDLAITGGGLTPFEAAAAGLPSVVIANEDFEIPVGRALEGLGCSIFAGHHTAVNERIFHRMLPLKEMSIRATQEVDLNGALRVADLIEELRH